MLVIISLCQETGFVFQQREIGTYGDIKREKSVGRESRKMIVRYLPFEGRRRGRKEQDRKHSRAVNLGRKNDATEGRTEDKKTAT